MKTRVLVTGGAGYIGSILVPLLLQQDCQVTVLDSFIRDQTSLLACCASEDFAVIHGDCRDRTVLRSALSAADVILPLAAVVGAPACDADTVAAQSINYDAIKLLLELRSPEQRILFPCTNSGYGVGEKDKFCTEETPLRPVSLYGRTKVDAEAAILDAGNGLSLRLATVFGVSPRMRLDLLVNDFVYRAVTDGFVVVFEGQFKRNYIHVRDVAQAFLFALERFETMKEQPYNVGLSEANLSKLELCAEIQRKVPRFVYLEAPVGQDPDKRDYIVSNAKIERLGFRPSWSLQAGIDELLRAYSMVRRNDFTNLT
ncbi:MAG: NAD(P)-dependent oxidoreductase [Chloroflexota bacterium]|nr:NAD(P)-dependent oxidoreductase [Chloroflexota bacterium]